MVGETRRDRTPRLRWWMRDQEMGPAVVVCCLVLVAVDCLLLELAGSEVVGVEEQHLELVQQVGMEVEVEVAEVGGTEHQEDEMTGQDVEESYETSEMLCRVVVARLDCEVIVEKAEATVTSQLSTLNLMVQLDRDQAWEVCKLGAADWAI
ncbi:hypothetical protein VP1G_06073 [Cytospora mali]|uniref:Uncharacterized protein n=1 Tax=Cytospora mali TaxID=578113 RepID=A0A194V4P8_CYTMA|nr:hypothetical protein VP1G_06073 [Valsa mali var. pyri (nom. inval.)]